MLCYKSVPKFEIRVCLYGDIHSEIFLRAIAFFLRMRIRILKTYYFPRKLLYMFCEKKQIELFVKHLKSYLILASQGSFILFIFSVLKKTIILIFMQVEK